MSRKTRAQLDREIMEWLSKEDSRTLGKYERRSDDRTRDGKIVLGDVVSYRDRNRNVVSGVVKSIDARDDALWSGSKSDALAVKQYRDPTYKGDVNITAIVPQSDVLAINGRRVSRSAPRRKTTLS